MKHLLSKLAISVAATLVTACAAPFPGPQDRPTSAARIPNWGPSIEARLLSAHNQERALVGSTPLEWDSQLQQAAAAYARQLAASGQFQHATTGSLQRQGENIWKGTGGAFTPERMVADWASGRRNFQPGIFPNVSRTGNWMDVGHYSQIIWPQTTRVGCSLYPSGAFDFLVCRYLPAGNVVGGRVP